MSLPPPCRTPGLGGSRARGRTVQDAPGHREPLQGLRAAAAVDRRQQPLGAHSAVAHSVRAVQPVDAGAPHHRQTDRHRRRPPAAAALPLRVVHAGHTDRRGRVRQAARLDAFPRTGAVRDAVRSAAGPRPVARAARTAMPHGVAPCAGPRHGRPPHVSHGRCGLPARPTAPHDVRSLISWLGPGPILQRGYHEQMGRFPPSAYEGLVQKSATL